MKIRFRFVAYALAWWLSCLPVFGASSNATLSLLQRVGNLLEIEAEALRPPGRKLELEKRFSAAASRGVVLDHIFARSEMLNVPLHLSFINGHILFHWTELSGDRLIKLDIDIRCDPGGRIRTVDSFYVETLRPEELSGIETMIVPDRKKP